MKTFAALSLLAVLAVPVAAAASDSEAAPTADGVRAVETHWSKAFMSGDTAYLEQLLTPGYVSVSAAGVARDRATIIAAAQKYAATAHPAASAAAKPEMTVALEGTTAVVTFAGKTERSADVFFYADGAWHALYSQHTSVAPK